MNCLRINRLHITSFLKVYCCFILSLFVEYPSFSQVQNKFFDATLGYSDINTTYSCMSRYFGKDPTPVNFSQQMLSLRNVSYAGYKWMDVNAIIHNGKFAQFALRNSLGFTTSQNIKSLYDSLKQALITKYGNRIKMTSITKEWESGICYFDGKYEVLLTIRWDLDMSNERRYIEVTLLYSDIQLLREPLINEEL